MFRRVFLACLAVVALGLPGASAQRYVRDPYSPQQVVPLERVLPQIRRGYPGTFYDAEGPFPDEMGNPHYHIKWLTPEGRVIWLDTDARTGRVLGVNGSGWRNQFRAAPRYNAVPQNYPPPGWDRGNNYRGGYPGNGYPGGGRWAYPHGANPHGQPGGGNPRGHHGH